MLFVCFFFIYVFKKLFFFLHLRGDFFNWERLKVVVFFVIKSAINRKPLLTIWAPHYGIFNVWIRVLWKLQQIVETMCMSIDVLNFTL